MTSKLLRQMGVEGPLVSHRNVESVCPDATEE